MNKKYIIVFVTALVFILWRMFSAGSSDTPDKPSKATENSVPTYFEGTSKIVETSEELNDVNSMVYFAYDELVNNLINNMSFISGYEIDPVDVRKGNINSKALLYVKDFNIEIIHNEHDKRVSVSIENTSNNDELLYSVYKGFVMSLDNSLSNDEVEKAWYDICENNYAIDYNNTGFVDSYSINNIQMAYRKNGNKTVELWCNGIDSITPFTDTNYMVTTETPTTPVATAAPSIETTTTNTTVPVVTTTTIVTTTPAPVVTEVTYLTYILNTNTMKFHWSYCWQADRIKEENLDSFTGSRDAIIAQGYSPCGTCNP